MSKHANISDFWVDVFKVVLFLFCLAESIYIPTIIILKLCNVINWPWYLVLIPLELDAVVSVLGMIIIGIEWIVCKISDHVRGF